MVKRAFSIPDDIDKKFRHEVVKRLGYAQGNLSKAIVQAIKLWIKFEDKLTDEERKIMDPYLYASQKQGD